MMETVMPWVMSAHAFRIKAAYWLDMNSQYWSADAVDAALSNKLEWAVEYDTAMHVMCVIPADKDGNSLQVNGRQLVLRFGVTDTA